MEEVKKHQDILSLWSSWIPYGALAAADDLRLVDSLQSVRTPAELAEEHNCNSYGLEIVLRLLESQGFLQQESGGYRATAAGRRYLSLNSPYYVKDLLRAKRLQEGYLAVKSILSPDSSSHRLSITDNWEKGSVSSKEALYFTGLMESMIRPYSDLLGKNSIFDVDGKIMDVGGGSGAISRSIATNWKKPKFILFDLSEVCKVSKSFVEQDGLGDRISFHPGDFFNDEWPKNIDLIQFSNIYHDWPKARCKHLSRSAFASLNPGGQIVLHELLLPESGPTELFTACFDFLMYLNHGAQQFRFSDLRNILSEAGFQNIRQETVAGSPYAIVVGKKPN